MNSTSYIQLEKVNDLISFCLSEFLENLILLPSGKLSLWKKRQDMDFREKIWQIKSQPV